MYNLSVKQDFLNHQEHSNKSLKGIDRYKHLFEKVSVFEEVLQKDIAEMNMSEFQYVFSTIDINGSHSYTRGNLSMIKQYFNWCCNQGKFKVIIDINNMDIQIQMALSITFKQQMVFSPEDLINKCDLIFPDVKELRIDNFLRAILYLTFCGFDLTSIYKIESKELDKLFSDKMIFSEFRSHLDIINNMKYYYKGDREINLIKSPSYNLLIKNFTDERKSIASFKAKLSKSVKKYNDENNLNISLSYKNVLKSGVYYRAYLQEKNNSPLNLIDPQKVLGMSNFTFKNEYKAYKQAFGH